MIRSISLILVASFVSVTASAVAASPESMDVAVNTPSLDKTSTNGPKLALAHLADPSPVVVGWESLRAQPQPPATHSRLQKRRQEHSKDNNKGSKKGGGHLNKNGKKNENKNGNKGERKPDNRSGNKTFHGRGTWFNDTFGSCGIKFSQSDLIVALNEEQMGGSGRGTRCGQRIRVTAKGSNASVVVRVVDTCPKKSCKFGMLDLSKAAFRRFAAESKGVLDLSWSFI
ncbi:hypothetical protein BGZ68_006060 [Mortierella alpina]|nr:hypothetical protein BGZ68_006060 [Mortierella alpina]